MSFIYIVNIKEENDKELTSERRKIYPTSGLEASTQWLDYILTVSVYLKRT